MLLFDTFTNNETNSFIEFGDFSGLNLFIVSFPVLVIFLFLANVMIDKRKSLTNPIRKWYFLIDLLISAFIISAYPTFECIYNTSHRNATIHKAKVFESNYYQKLTSDEKDYFKLELLDKNGGCINNNITCKDGFDYYLKLKDIDQIISDIKKQRETKKPSQTTSTIENPLNKKFWELIQK